MRFDSISAGGALVLGAAACSAAVPLVPVEGAHRVAVTPRPAGHATIGVFEAMRVPVSLPDPAGATRGIPDTFDSEVIVMDTVPLSLFAYLQSPPGGQSLLADGLFQPAGTSVVSGAPIEAGAGEIDNGDGTQTIVMSTRIAPLSDGFLPLGVTFTGGTPVTAMGWLLGVDADRDSAPDAYVPDLIDAFPPAGAFTVVGADIFLLDNGFVIGSGSFSGLPFVNQTDIGYFITVSNAAGSSIDEIIVQYLVQSAVAATEVALTPVEDCLDAGQSQFVVEIDASGLPALAVGGQFFLEYDETLLGFVSADPGDGPFTREVYEAVDGANGLIDYAVGVPDGDTGTAVPTTMARLTFDILGEFCSTSGLVTFRTGVLPPSRITDALGNDLGAALIDLGPVTADATPPSVTPPPPIAVNADAGGCDAVVSVPPLVAGDNCALASVVNDYNGTADASDVYPQGTTTVTWTATDACGNETAVTQDITVNPVNAVDVAVELVSVDPGPFDRCITFVFTPAGGGPAVEAEATLTFTGGVASGTVEIPCGDYDCVTARDALHTLRATDTDDFGITGPSYIAAFLAGPGDDDSLVGGNLNGDAFIDILDFGVFIAQFGDLPGAGTPCGFPSLHADISGDGEVGTADFTYIQAGFLESNEPDCDGALLRAGDDGSPEPVIGHAARPRTSVRVSDLLGTEMAALARADLDRDGDVDTVDIAAFFSGVRPDHLADLNADGVVDTADMLVFADRYHLQDAAADVNRDGRVDLGDLVFITNRIGTEIPG